MSDNETLGRRAASAAITELCEMYRTELSDHMLKRYINKLWVIEPKSWKGIIDRIEDEERFFPAVATIRNAALNSLGRESAEEGWDYVCGRLSRYGFNGGLGPVSEEIKAGVDACGGWWGISRSGRPDRDRFTFIQAFNQCRERLDRNVLVRNGASQQMPDELIEGMKQIGRGGNDGPI